MERSKNQMLYFYRDLVEAKRTELKRKLAFFEKWYYPEGADIPREIPENVKRVVNKIETYISKFLELYDAGIKRYKALNSIDEKAAKTYANYLKNAANKDVRKLREVISGLFAYLESFKTYFDLEEEERSSYILPNHYIARVEELMSVEDMEINKLEHLVSTFEQNCFKPTTGEYNKNHKRVR